MTVNLTLQDDESVDASTFAVNRDEPSDDERDFGTYEEQKLRMEERIKELDRLKETTQNSDKEGRVHTVVELQAHDEKLKVFKVNI